MCVEDSQVRRLLKYLWKEGEGGSGEKETQKNIVYVVTSVLPRETDVETSSCNYKGSYMR